MKHIRDHLKVLFFQIQPEALYDSVCKQEKTWEWNREDGEYIHLNGRKISPGCYRHFSHNIYEYATSEEVDNLFADMKQRLDRAAQKEGDHSGIFRLLWEYTRYVLKIENGQPVCRQEQLVEWRRCSFFLGQDILTTAHLAREDMQREGKTISFVWPAQVRTDDRRFHAIMQRGLAENHYHLNGSTRMFDLSWICMMNHPRQIGLFFGEENRKHRRKQLPEDLFLENLNPGTWYGVHDNKWGWKQRLLVASYVRGLLFRWLYEGDPAAGESGEDVRFRDLLDRAENAPNLVWGLRCRYGPAGAFEQQKSRYAVLDYAITGAIMAGMTPDNPYRMLAGERALLYHGFYKIYCEDFENQERMHRFMDLFYLYLLLKVQFRSEMIQVNQRPGFHNFVLYQNRKERLFGKFPEYSLEAKRLSVGAGLCRENIKSLEIRIGPSMNPSNQRQWIRKLDRDMQFVCKEGMDCEENGEGREDRREKILQGSKLPYFYVLHFPKTKETDQEKYLEDVCRNVALRRKTRRQTLAIAQAMAHSSWLCTRVRGIDTCTYEIGCRPEVFGTEFRFLRNFVPNKELGIGEQGGLVYPRLSASYHVGEDFLDLSDGLRAIDEAMLFLELQRGDRLGHALALGVDPDDYYQFKKHRIIINKQDYLDNLVWMLYRAQSLNIDMPKLLYQRFKSKADQLVSEIYGGSYTLQMYYNSWKLRGDDPKYYRTGRCRQGEEAYGLEKYVQRYELRQSEELDIYRKQYDICELYSHYHYKKEVKEKGAEIESVDIDRAYVDLIRMLQDGLQREVAKKGIGIECNPSSNVLIGPFQQYRQHPIFRFHPLNREVGDDKIMVSVNTDDQGVFDTSLENEFALLTSCLCTEEIPCSGKQYSADEIYEYIDHLRLLGFAQVFPPAHPR